MLFIFKDIKTYRIYYNNIVDFFLTTLIMTEVKNSKERKAVWVLMFLSLITATIKRIQNYTGKNIITKSSNSEMSRRKIIH